jgi:hypothetical protein
MIPRLSSLRDCVSASQVSAMSLTTAGKQIQVRMIGTSVDTEQSQHTVEDVIVAVRYVPMALQSRQIDLLLGKKTVGSPE